MSTSGAPVRVAIVNDYELVVVGVAALLAPYEDRVQVVELDANLPVLRAVDVVLYDTFGQIQGRGIDMAALRDGGEAKVAVYSWNLHQELVQESLDAGANGYISKALDAEELVQAIERIHAGETVVPSTGGTVTPKSEADYPGKKHGLTVRESEILALITQGLSNKEIAQRSYLSINSVKTYIRTAYRKIGVERRTQAVLWATRNGLVPSKARLILGDP